MLTFLSNRLILFTLAIWLTYAVVTLISPLGSNVLNLTKAQIFWIRITIVLPYLLVWVSGVWGAGRLAEYAEKITESKDGQVLLWISRGLFVLLAGMMLSALVGLLRSYKPEIEIWNAPIQIFSNIINVFAPLAGFFLMWWGTRGLYEINSRINAVAKQIFPILIIIGLLAGLFVIGVFTNPDRQTVVSPDVEYPSYYFSDGLIALIIIIPAIISWFLGALSANTLGRFHRSVKAPVYKRGLTLLVRGLYMAIVGNILLDFLLSLGSARLIGLGLGWLLVVIYIWLLALAVGYVLIALGAKRLTLIENVKITT